MFSSSKYDPCPADASLRGSSTNVARRWTAYTYPSRASTRAPLADFAIDGYVYYPHCSFFHHRNAVDFSAGSDNPRVKSVDEFIGVADLNRRLQTMCSYVLSGNVIQIIESSFRQEFGFSIHEEPTLTDINTFQAYCQVDGESLLIIRTHGPNTDFTFEPPSSDPSSFMDLVTQRLESRTYESNNRYLSHFRTHIRQCIMKALPPSLKGEQCTFKNIVETTDFPEDLLAILVERYRMAYTAELVRKFLLSKFPVNLRRAISITPERFATLSQVLTELSDCMPTTYEYMNYLMTNLYGTHLEPYQSKDDLNKQLIKKYQNSVDTQASLLHRLGPNYATLFHNYSLYKNWLTCATHIYKDSTNLSAAQKAALQSKSFEDFYKSEGPRDNGWKILEEFGKLFNLVREPVQISVSKTDTKEEQVKGVPAPGTKADQKEPEKSPSNHAVTNEKAGQTEPAKSPSKQTAPDEKAGQKGSVPTSLKQGSTNGIAMQKAPEKASPKPAVTTQKSVQDSAKIFPKQPVLNEKSVKQEPVKNPSVGFANGKQASSSVENMANGKTTSEQPVKYISTPVANGKPVREGSVTSVTAANGKAPKAEPGINLQPQKAARVKAVPKAPRKFNLNMTSNERQRFGASALSKHLESMPDSLLSKVETIRKNSSLNFKLSFEESRFLDATISSDAIVEEAKRLYVQRKKSDPIDFYGSLNGKYGFCKAIFT